MQEQENDTNFFQYLIFINITILQYTLLKYEA